MLRFVLWRLAVLPPMLAAVSVLIFTLFRMGRGDPAMDYLRLSQIPPSDANLAMARDLLGLNKPLVEQYLDWAWNALHLDFGLSYVTRKPVLDEVLYYLPATAQLAAVAFVVTLGVSIPLGIWAAKNRDGWPDQVVRGLAFVGVSLPNFWLGFLLVLFFTVWLGVLPPFGKGGPAHLVMPVIAVSLMSLSINARLLRSSMLEVAGQRHVTYARMRGLSERSVTRNHILLNALLPVVTASGMHLGELIGGAMIVENIFAWPGLGRYAVGAIHNRDYPVLQCFALLMTVIFVLCNLIIDIIYAWLDPRIRMAGQGGVA